MKRFLGALLAIFLPPLSVRLHRGLGTAFAFSLVFTLCFYVPGVVHALWLRSSS